MENILETREKNVGEVLQMASTADLIQILKCPGCNELPIPPIYNCIYGHSMCTFCSCNFIKCIICDEKMTNSRSLLLESVIESSFIKCKYSTYGCTRILTGGTYRDHILSCDLRPVQCYEKTNQICTGKNIHFKDYFTHLQEYHRIEGFDTEHEFYEKSECIPSLKSSLSLPLFYLTYDDKVFLKHVEVKNSKVHWWISLIGTQTQADKYGATIILYRKDLEDMKVEFKIPVHSFRKNIHTIIEKAECASLSISQLPPFCLMDSTFLNEHERIEYLWEMKYAIWKIQ